MATWDLAVSASGSSHDMAVASNAVIGFYGDNYSDTIQIGNFQSSIHILNADNSDECDGHPAEQVENLQYVDGSNVYHRGAASSGALGVSSVENTSLFRYHFNHGSAVSTSGATFYAYDGSTPATPAPNVAAFAFEVDDASWTAASGSANALSITNQGSATDHYYYIGVSVSPQTVGTKSGWKTRLELTYY